MCDHTSPSLSAEMIATGELVPAERPSGILGGKPSPPLELGFSASEELQRLRADERY